MCYCSARLDMLGPRAASKNAPPVPGVGRRRAPAWPLGLLLLPAPAWSQASDPPTPDDAVELTALTLDELMSLKVTTVSRKPEPWWSAPSGIDVVTGDDIRRAGALRLPDALRLATGVHVGQPSARSWAVSIRGMNVLAANKISASTDGRSLFTPFFSGIQWDVQELLLDDVDRIEVVRGPVGALWGAYAVNGFIQVLTKPAGDTQGLLLSVARGSEDPGAGRPALRRQDRTRGRVPRLRQVLPDRLDGAAGRTARADGHGLPAKRLPPRRAARARHDRQPARRLLYERRPAARPPGAGRRQRAQPGRPLDARVGRLVGARVRGIFRSDLSRDPAELRGAPQHRSRLREVPVHVRPAVAGGRQRPAGVGRPHRQHGHRTAPAARARDPHRRRLRAGHADGPPARVARGRGEDRAQLVRGVRAAAVAALRLDARRHGPRSGRRSRARSARPCGSTRTW